jgi:hydrogenase nickel incorporation protein HypB
MDRVSIEKHVLSENDRIARSLRERFRECGVLVLNCISSPGSGKTSLLERTLEALPRDRHVAVLTGDIQTDNDARRLARFGFPVRQITTAGACHLDARMVEKALEDWDLSELDLLIIENVGNLVCPTSYDLGEDVKIVILSVTEGDDKPLKYPGAFRKSSLMVLNKIDLLPYVAFDSETAAANARSIHPGIEILNTSCTTGEGLDSWYRWIQGRLETCVMTRKAPAPK